MYNPKKIKNEDNEPQNKNNALCWCRYLWTSCPPEINMKCLYVNVIVIVIIMHVHRVYMDRGNGQEEIGDGYNLGPGKF